MDRHGRASTRTMGWEKSHGATRRDEKRKPGRKTEAEEEDREQNKKNRKKGRRTKVSLALLIVGALLPRSSLIEKETFFFPSDRRALLRETDQCLQKGKRRRAEAIGFLRSILGRKQSKKIKDVCLSVCLSALANRHPLGVFSSARLTSFPPPPPSRKKNGGPFPPRLFFSSRRPYYPLPATTQPGKHKRDKNATPRCINRQTDRQEERRRETQDLSNI